MENIPKEWFSIQTVKEFGGMFAIGAASGVYGLASAIRHKWVSLSSNVETSIELAKAQTTIEHNTLEIERLKDEVAELKDKIETLESE